MTPPAPPSPPNIATLGPAVASSCHLEVGPTGSRLPPSTSSVRQAPVFWSFHGPLRLSRVALLVVPVVVLLVLCKATAAHATVGEVVQLNTFGEAFGNRAYGIATNEATDTVYMGDTEPLSERYLFAFTRAETQEEVNTGLSFGERGSEAGQVGSNGAAGMAINTHSDPTTLLVLDPANERIDVYNAETLAYESELAIPQSASREDTIAVNSYGILLLPCPESNSVSEVNASGAIVGTITGSGEAALDDPTAVAVAPSGAVYVLDHPSGSGRVQRFSEGGEYQTTIVPNDADAFATDPSNGDLWVVVGPPGEGEMVDVYSPTGELIADTQSVETIGSGEAEIKSLAVEGSTHEAVATVRHYGGRQDRLGIRVPGKPIVESQRVVATSTTTASVAAELNPGSLETTYEFDYGTTSAYGNAMPVPSASLGATSLPQEVTAELTGLAPNTLYHFRVKAENAEGEATGADQMLITNPTPPQTGETVALSSEGAIVTGSFNPEGQETRYYVQYGARPCGPTACEAQTKETNDGSGFDQAHPMVTLSGLTPLTVYHYRFVITNAIAGHGGGASYGPEREFLTPTAPLAITDLPSTVGATTATVLAEVIPNGANTSYHIEYGTTTSYGESTPLPEGTLSGTPISRDYLAVTLYDLAPDTEYHYRIVAHNDSGESFGDDETFTTNSNGESSNNPLPSGFSLTGGLLGNPSASSYPSLAGFAPLSPLPIGTTSTTKRTTIKKTESCQAKAKKIKSKKKHAKALKQCKSAKAKSKSKSRSNNKSKSKSKSK